MFAILVNKIGRKSNKGLFTPPLGPSSGIRAGTSFAGEILCIREWTVE